MNRTPRESLLMPLTIVFAGLLLLACNPPAPTPAPAVGKDAGTVAPAQKPAERAIEKPLAEPKEEPAKKPAEEAMEKPSAEPEKAPAERPADVVKETIEKAVAPPAVVDQPQKGPVQAAILPQFGLVKAGEETTLNVLVRLTADKIEVHQRSPLDLAIIIDRSGSMRGDKVRQVKQAAMNLIDKLDRMDRVTLISYASDVMVHDRRLPMDAPGREALKNKIAILWAGGSTALGPALFDGLDILGKADREETDIAHVLMLSDGIANVGESRPDRLAAATARAFGEGVSVSTLGVGLDYNEDLMTRLADQGGGRYHFAKDGEAIAGILNDEFAGLSATVARSMVLTFKSKDGVKLQRVFGYATWEEDDETRIKVGTLHSGQTREILLQVRVTPAGMEKLAVGDLGLKFVDVGNDGTRVVHSFPLAVGVTEDGEGVKESENTEVTIRVAEVESAEAMDRAARAVDRGDWQAARTIIDGSIGQLRSQNEATPSKRIVEQLQDMEESVAGLGAAETSAEDRKSFIKRSKAKSYDKMK